MPKLPQNDLPEKLPVPTGKQLQMIDYLLQGHDLETTAQKLGVNRKTLYLWRNLPHVDLAYKTAQKTLFNETLERLQIILGFSINTLVEIMNDKESPVASRVKSAQALMDHAISYYHSRDLEERLTVIEKQTKGKKP